jgi:hypothetical protein
MVLSRYRIVGKEFALGYGELLDGSPNKQEVKMGYDNISGLLLWGYSLICVLFSAFWVRIFIRDNRHFRAIRNNKTVMKRQITLGEFLASIIIIFGSIITIYVNIHTTLAEHEVRITQLEQNYKDISQQLKQISDQNTTILVRLEDKENRPLK